MSARTCPRCGATYRRSAAFCAQCGERRAEPERGGVRLAISLYLALLAIQLVAIIVVRAGGDELAAIELACVGIALVTIVVAAWHRDLVRPLYVSLGWSWLGYALVLAAAPVILAAVIAYVHALTAVFGPQGVDELAPFAGHSWALALVVIAITPPLYEELAFRGLVLGALRTQLSTREAIFISAFAFALLHLSLPSMITHLPLGLYLGWLRVRSGSIWPGTFAHFCHNLGVVLLAR